MFCIHRPRTLFLDSKPTLEFVAKIINEDIKIGHLVIEGHASEEGSFDYNYDLSNLRARAIYRALTASGVHPDRMSYRGYGEALPKVMGSDEASLAKNRRVEFHIVRIDPATGPLPELRDVKTKPWDGTPLRSIIPELKEMPKEVKKDIFEFDDEDDDLFEELQEDTSEPKPEEEPEKETDAPNEQPPNDTPKEESP